MPIPDFQTLMLPVLRLLSDGADRTARSAIEALSDEFELTPEEREQLVGSQRIGLMASRVHWAMTYLVHAGLTGRPRRGVWRITDEGRRLVASGPELRGDGCCAPDATSVSLGLNPSVHHP